MHFVLRKSFKTWIIKTPSFCSLNIFQTVLLRSSLPGCSFVLIKSSQWWFFHWCVYVANNMIFWSLVVMWWWGAGFVYFFVCFVLVFSVSKLLSSVSTQEIWVSNVAAGLSSLVLPLPLNKVNACLIALLLELWSKVVFLFTLRHLISYLGCLFRITFKIRIIGRIPLYSGAYIPKAEKTPSFIFVGKDDNFMKAWNIVKWRFKWWH